jgi:histidinol-phosphatase (PHP family)
LEEGGSRMVDCHIHSSFSPDSSEKIEDIVDYCIKNNIKTIGISDHYDFRNPDPLFSKGFDIDSYVSAIERVSKKMDLLKGIEIGYDPREIKKINDLGNDENFDYSILSVHTIFDKNLHDEMFFRKDNTYDQFKVYFKHIRDMVDNVDDFQILGHLDYPSRYKDYLDMERIFNENKDTIADIFKILIMKEKALEVNGAGLRYYHKEPNPSKNILTLYKDLGGKLISYGSDAHYKNYVGFGWETVSELLKNVGFLEAHYFKNKEIVGYKV